MSSFLSDRSVVLYAACTAMDRVLVDRRKNEAIRRRHASPRSFGGIMTAGYRGG